MPVAVTASMPLPSPSLILIPFPNAISTGAPIGRSARTILGAKAVADQ